jgi:hypothetical protein
MSELCWQLSKQQATRATKFQIFIHGLRLVLAGKKKSNKSKRTLNRIGIHHSVWLGRLLQSSSETIPVTVVAAGRSPKTQPLQIQTRCSVYFSFSVSQQPKGG